ncbi:SDR family NAD(P)-dependent oxidoreductase [Actinoallomurus soli]|uniref:SDR family NAD(P)-dependent oxidoreductase n=1 Tax=Actinoallomurus soli TaxID=2952535 RepID=UPI002093254A|nr:SDR family NAD(P)-dependent oxidoreductase [Actinoallomurus soli]MCO5973839.1 SDR family oxidoreductase [Actinoallomurus soli]
MVHESLVNVISLNGRRAVVTGAGSGIGRAAAVILAKAGASVLALDIDREGLSATKGVASQVSDVELDVATVDVSDLAAIESVLSDESLDIVVNSAGIMAPDSLATTSGQDWDRVLAVNLTGYFNVLKSAVPHMNRPGSIIQISSMMGHIGLAFPAYTAAKGAILSLSRQLAGELGPDGIRVNSVSPGMILTGMTQDDLSDGDQRHRIADRTPLRTVGAPDDIANAVLYLASDLSAFVTGTDILIDGGLISTLDL